MRSGSPGSIIRAVKNREQNVLKTAQLQQAMGLLGRSRLPPIRGYTPSAPRYGLPCVGCLKQMPNAMFQQSDGPLQGAELSNPHYRDGHVQIKRWRAQHFNLVDGNCPGNKASWQQPDSISRLNKLQLQMHVVDFSRNHRGEAGTVHLINKVCPSLAPGRIEHPGCFAEAFPVGVDVACGALNDLPTVRRDDIRQKWWRGDSTFGQKHSCNVELTGEEPVK